MHSVSELHKRLYDAHEELTYIILDSLAIIGDPEILPALALALARYPLIVEYYICHGAADRVKRLLSVALGMSNEPGDPGLAARQLIGIFDRVGRGKDD